MENMQFCMFINNNVSLLLLLLLLLLFFFFIYLYVFQLIDGANVENSCKFIILSLKNMLYQPGTL